jgi:hypothetical protein
VAVGIREVVVFHSSVAEMQPYQGDLPFAAIADPEKHLYAEFGVESSLRAVLSANALGAAIRGAITGRLSKPKDPLCQVLKRPIWNWEKSMHVKRPLCQESKPGKEEGR